MMKPFLLVLLLALWTEPVLASQPDSVLIYVHAGGVHSDLILPVENSYCNWRCCLAYPTHDPQSDEWLAFGWGSKLFYLNTPEWRNVKIKHILGAMIGVGGAAYHVHSQHEPEISDHCRAIRLHQSEYLALCDFLKKQFRTDKIPVPMIALKPAKNWDAFYEARGYYWLLNNCNTWSNRALQACNRSKRKWALTYSHILNP